MKEIFNNKNITKIFHACHQDIEIIKKSFTSQPYNIFDTQIAAEICDLGKNIGYSDLCRLLLGVKIDKKMQNSNWLERPLKKEALLYAHQDTKYLIRVYKMLNNIIDMRDLSKYFCKKMNEVLFNIDFCKSPQIIANKIVDNIQIQLNMNHLLQLVKLREEIAQKLNLPRRFCATDRDIVRICKYLPTNSKDLLKLVSKNCKMFSAKFINNLLTLCKILKTS